MAGSQKSPTSFSMVPMSVEPSLLVSVATRLPCSFSWYSPYPELKLKAGRLSRKEHRRFMYVPDWDNEGILSMLSWYYVSCLGKYVRSDFQQVAILSYLMKSLCVILVLLMWSGMYSARRAWQSLAGRSRSKLDLTGTPPSR